MANPEVKTLTKDSITKIATNVITGQIHRLVPRASYLYTYRETGDPAPTVETEFINMFDDSSTAQISSSSGIDIYVVCKRKDGAVRVDL